MMDYVRPPDLVRAMLVAAATKGALGPLDLVVRGALAGAMLGIATALAFVATVQTGLPIIGALVFPVGFIMIVLLNLELVTGSFGLLPLAVADRKLGVGTMLANFAWVFLGNALGAICFGGLLAVALTGAGAGSDATGLVPKIVAVAQAKTLAYAKLGAGAGFLTAFVKGVLCNWMVALGVVLAMGSRSTIGKIASAYLPIFLFFALGFEHSVVNLFVIPTGMMLGAKITIAQWLWLNQIPVTLGNFVGGYLFTGLALAWTYRPSGAQSEPELALAPGVATA